MKWYQYYIDIKMIDIFNWLTESWWLLLTACLGLVAAVTASLNALLMVTRRPRPLFMFTCI